MQSNLIIFAGAGASRGVSKEKYPTAIDFRRRLPDDVTATPLFRQLDDYLTRMRGKDVVDIEHVLWELGRLVETLEEMTAKETFAAELLTTNQVIAITGHQNQGQATHSQLNQLKQIALALQNLINQNIYDFYAQAPSDEELRQTWVPLLEWASTSSFARVDLVTTNYDLILEYALRLVPALRVDAGLGQDVLPVIDLHRWDEGCVADSGLLTKLHGSVDWKLGNGGTADRPVIRRGHPEFDGDHAKRLILYPGFKGRPDRQPFIAFHEYFKHRLTQATHLLFIGFAFRDEFINEVVATSISPSARIAVVDPTPKLAGDISFLERAVHLSQAFGTPKVKTLLTDDGMKPFNLGDVMSWAK